MRCADLVGTWEGLLCWFDDRRVLVLPRLTGVGATVRLDGDIGCERPAEPAEVALVLDRLRGVVERFGIPAVYVGQVRVGAAGRLASVTVRAPAGGVIHELTLAAAWYGAQDIDLDRAVFPSDALS
jgi:hypothetical protein